MAPKCSVATVFALAWLLAAPAAGEADGPDYYDVRGVTTSDALGVRAEADPRAPLLGEIPADGTCLRNRGCIGGLSLEEFTTLGEPERREIERARPRWCRVEHGGLVGWVPGRSLREARGDCRDETAPRGGPANATYAEVYEDPVTLRDGVFEGEPFAEGGASRPRVELLREMSQRGDLDGDGAEETVALLSESSGGSGEHIYLAVLRERAGAWRNVGTALVGDRVRIRALVLESDRIRLEVLQAGPGDAMCCPGELATREWSFGPDGLREVRTEVSGRLSLATLVGPEWVLSHLERGEPAPAASRATLRIAADGSVSGGAGCNRFHGSFEETGTAALRAGPLTSTRMACPPPAMQLEDVFLPRLQAVTGFGFQLGRLALSWRRADGASGVLLFEAAE